MWVEPRLAGNERPDRPVPPWFGLIVVLLLALGLAFVGIGVDGAVRETLPHREATPP